jgi:hypothetical protein
MDAINPSHCGFETAPQKKNFITEQYIYTKHSMK